MEENQQRNKEHYEKLYGNYNIKNILYWLHHLDAFLDSATTTETSWHSLYQENFRERLNNKKVLEMGCGDCVNAAVMAGLGAEVYANDIADASGEIVKKLNENYAFKYPIKFLSGDFMKNDLESGSFDFVIGKAFLHHLILPVEKLFLKETARLLKSDGEARFFEPAVNNKILDEIRWHIPVSGRPSKFQRKAFKIWKENDPHPDRSFSSDHFMKVGAEFFSDIQIFPLGALERFSRLMRWGNNRNTFKKWALKKEKYLPGYLKLSLARGQLIIYSKPNT